MNNADEYPLISIIVPIYGVEPYLRECVDSLIAQSYKNIEIVLVDDGSPDACGSICDEYATRDNRIVALHKPNGGLSDARNCGLRKAKGDIVAFVDSDDWVSPIFIESLFMAMDRYDVQVSAMPGGHSYRDGEQIELESDLGVVEQLIQSPIGSHEALELMLYQRMATGIPWRLYRRSVLGEDPFPVGLYYEDLASTYKLVHRAGSISVVNCRNLYAYRLRNTSIIRQKYSPIKASSALAVAEQLYSDISEWYPDLSDAAASRCFSVCRMVFAQLPERGSEDEEVEPAREALWAVLEQHRDTVLHDNNARRRERIAAAVACLGRGPFTLFCRAARKAGLLR